MGHLVNLELHLILEVGCAQLSQSEGHSVQTNSPSAGSSWTVMGSSGDSFVMRVLGFMAVGHTGLPMGLLYMRHLQSWFASMHFPRGTSAAW